MYPRNNRFRRPHGLRPAVGIGEGDSRPGLRVSGLLLAVVAIAALAVGCFSRDPMRIKGSGLPGDDSASAEAGAATQNAPAPGATSDENAQTRSAAALADDAALNRIWQERSAELTSTKDYPIGPGDVLTVSVPQMEELQDRKVRVTPLGTIELPLVGSVRAGGLTEEQLEAELDQKLNNFMYNPQASVYVNEYHNREVAVIGSVNRPGLVLLNSPSETILDVLTQAGGLASTAADEIVLIPVEQGDPSMAQRLSQVAFNSNGITANGATATDAGTPGAEAGAQVGQAGEIMPHQPGSGIQGGNAAIEQHARQVAQGPPPPPEADLAARTMSMMPGNAHPLSIKIKSTSLTGAGKYINMPMRPGDVIVVPGGGNVMVIGWVQTPGYFQVGSGLTVLGAIGAAGGPMYAANTRDITLIRSNRDGTKDTIPVDLDKVSTGEAQDIPVKANDVIDVPYSSVRIGPYVFYSILSRMGIGAPAW